MHNPAGAVGGVVKSMTSAFNLETMKKGGVVVGGVIANEYASEYLGIGLEKIVPSMTLTSGIPSYFVGLASAGLLAYGTKLVAPKYAGLVFLGGVVQVLKNVAKDYVEPHLPHLPTMHPAMVAPVAVHPAVAAAQAAGVSGFGDFLTPHNVQQARALNGFGDFLTPAGARNARALGDFASMAIADELDAM